jgi:uncharacterized coiled-coil protein SlyX
VPDDLARRLEGLQHSVETQPADLGRRLDKLETRLGKIDQQLAGLDKATQEAAKAQRKIEDRLEALDEKLTAYIAEDRAAREKQYALTALVDARADYDRQFGHRQMVRRAATGMLGAIATGTVRPAALLQAAEQLTVDASGYWLAPALVAVAAWVGDIEVTARGAALEAVSRDPGRSALFFSLTLARFGRSDPAAWWITEYAKAQDCNGLADEFTAVLDVVAQGGLGDPARERLLDACRGWRDQIGQSDTAQARQIANWTGFFRGRRRPLTDAFDPLGTVSRGWADKLGRLEAAAAFGHAERWLKGLLGGPGKGSGMLRDVADGITRELIAAPDQAEGALLEAIKRWQAIVEGGGHPPTPASGAPAEPVRTDFLTLCTAIATGSYERELSEQVTRFCLILSRAWAQRAITDLSQYVKSTYPPSIEIDIEGWHHAVRPGDGPEVLTQEFLGWAHKAMDEAKAQPVPWLHRIAGPAARIEQIEKTWQPRMQRGHEQVYLATREVNDFYGKWQEGIGAAERCIGLLRPEPTGAWSDAREPGPAPESAEPAMKLPGWDLHPADSSPIIDR